MKFTLILLLLTTACSKQIFGEKSSISGPKNPQAINPPIVIQDPLFASANYITMTDNELVEFDSQNIRVAEISEGELTYSFGLINNYSKNKDGTDRPGNHPPSEFRVQVARYKIHKVGDDIRLEFLSSSCANSSTNPFSLILPSTEFKMTQSLEVLSLKTSPTEEEVLYKADPGAVESLWSSNVTMVLCQGETNE